jgi:ADP-ribose pyrophosphatase
VSIMSGNDLFSHVSENVRYRGRMVTMSTMRWRGPDGEEFDRDCITHPGAVAVVPMLDDGSVVLVQQFRTPLFRETLELPAGVMDKDGESAVDAAARELLEETGYVAENLVELGVIHTAPGWSTEKITLFVGTGLHAGGREADGIEEQYMSTVILDPDEFDGLVESGELTDAKTVLGVLMVRAR